MRYSISLIALALASAVFALPTPKDSSSDDSGFTRGDTTSGDDSDSSSSADSDITTSSSGLGDSSTTSSVYGSYPTTTTGSYQTTSSSGSLPTFTPSPTATPVNTASSVDTATATGTGAAAPTSTSASTSNSTSSTTTNLLPCGSAQYDPLAYNCFDASFLCPIIAGHATFRCADACYLPDLYVCTDNQLSAASVTATGQTFPTGFPTGTMTLGGSGSGQTATGTGTGAGAVETGLVFGSTTDRSSETSDEAASGTTDKRGYAQVW
ncbi:MAG: hypothetical protein L6R37_006912 [Teloschistes peruensis]|nr:MAG: hypothetical protein L6R37_006912 [Teloschistes peruensis]